MKISFFEKCKVSLLFYLEYRIYKPPEVENLINLCLGIYTSHGLQIPYFTYPVYYMHSACQ